MTLQSSLSSRPRSRPHSSCAWRRRDISQVIPFGVAPCTASIPPMIPSACSTAFDLETAFVESIVRARAHPLPAGEPLLIDYLTLASRHVVTLAVSSPTRSLHLAQLYGAGLSAAKTDNRIATVDDYGTTRRWAKAFHAHPERIDGIVYMSRYLGDHRSVVLFDRARDAIAFNNPLPLLHHPELAQLLDTYHVSVAPPRGRKKKKKSSAWRRKPK